MNNKLYKKPKLPRKLKKAIKSIQLNYSKPKFEEVYSNYAIYAIRVRCRIKIYYKGRNIKSKLKAMYLLRNNYTKSLQVYYDNMKNKFN